jgi:hypothetical protein
MDFDKVKLNLFPFLVFCVIVIGMINFAVTQDRFWYQQETYRSWEIQQDYSEMLRQEINSKDKLIADLNTDLQICEVSRMYERELNDYE